MLQDSFAIFSSDKCEMDMHINIWTDMKNTNYIDVGLRIYKKDSFDTISMYFPYIITKDEIFDLAEIMKNETIMRGIFNQKCSITVSSSESYYDVKLDNYIMRVIPINLCIKSIETVAAGTVITFEITQWSENGIAYIRFRLPYKSLHEYLFAKRHMYLEALESPIMREKYLYNFKLNESRTLPKEVLRNVDNLAVIKSIKFFLCVPDKCSIGTENVYKTRIIENNIFEQYIPDKQFRKNSITYQLNYGKSLRYTLSTFFERKYINWISVIFYSLAIITLNILSSIIFEYLF